MMFLDFGPLGSFM